MRTIDKRHDHVKEYYVEAQKPGGEPPMCTRNQRCSMTVYKLLVETSLRFFSLLRPCSFGLVFI